MPGVWRSVFERLQRYSKTLELPMSVEFIGFITNNNSSETIVRSGPILDPPYIETVAKAHELAGFDRALLAFHSTTPDALQIGQHVLGITRKLKVMIAQRPGFTAPTLLARQLATLDQLSGGRVSLHVITGGNATELRQDGNTLDDKDERYARTSEFLDIVRAEWTSEKPFDYNGKYYKIEKGFSQIKPYQAGGIYTFVGGGSDAAIEVAGKHADTFALWGESYAQVRDVTARVRTAAARHGRPTPRFSLSVRPILADTEERAWAKAEEILARATALQDKTGYRKPADGHATAGARRLLELAEQGTRIDKRLWTEMAKLTGANSNTTALVGTPEQVAEVFGDYYDLGVSHFLIRGFDPLIDAIEYGRELIPLTRKLIAERGAAKGVAAAWSALFSLRVCCWIGTSAGRATEAYAECANSSKVRPAPRSQSAAMFATPSRRSCAIVRGWSRLPPEPPCLAKSRRYSARDRPRQMLPANRPRRWRGRNVCVNLPRRWRVATSIPV